MNDEIEPYLKRTVSVDIPESRVIICTEKIYGDSGENSCTALPGREAERRYYNQRHVFTEAAPKYEEMIIVFCCRISCVYAGTSGTWTKLSSDSRSISCTYRYLEAICERFFENMPCNKKHIPELPLVLLRILWWITLQLHGSHNCFQKIILLLLCWPAH